MKPVLKMSVLAATILLAVGCQDDNKADTNESVEPAKVEQVATTTAADEKATEATETDVTKVEFKTEDEKAAYAIGASLAQYLSANLEQQKELGLNLSSSDVLAGVEDVFADKSRLTSEQTQQVLQELDQRVAKIVEEKAKKKDKDSPPTKVINSSEIKISIPGISKGK